MVWHPRAPDPFIGPQDGPPRPLAVAADDLVANPGIANTDPYDKGWFIILKPDDWLAIKPTLTPGAKVTAKYEAKMAADGFTGCP